uniref:Uncharacterized protein n=1 Tax=Anguilla anguilla TaxID=7936 RepID=A0A0E9RAZ5_ANGAN
MNFLYLSWGRRLARSLSLSLNTAWLSNRLSPLSSPSSLFRLQHENLIKQRYDYIRFLKFITSVC